MEGEIMSSEVEPLSIVADANGAEVILHLDGELDPHTAPRLEEEIERWTAARRIVLDWTDLRFIDSSGLRVVIAAHRGLEERGAVLVLRNPSPTASRLLEITGLAAHLQIETAGNPT